MKKFAFTLAETLIVIGIIGVVAALTLPNLNHATGDKEKVTKVKKIYSALTDAVDRAQVIYGDFDTWFKDLSTDKEKSERFAKRVTEFMKVSKNCGFDDGCFSSSPLLSPIGTVIFNNYFEKLSEETPHYMLLLSEGTAVGFTVRGNEPTSFYEIHVDIDGPNKGKNQMGNDIFNFNITTIPNNDSVYSVYPSTLCLFDKTKGFTGKFFNGGEEYSGGNTAAWVIQNDNLDYLKCPDELNWETQTSCK